MKTSDPDERCPRVTGQEIHCSFCGNPTRVEADPEAAHGGDRIAEHTLRLGVVRPPAADRPRYDRSPVLPEEIGRFVRVDVRCPMSGAIVTGLSWETHGDPPRPCSTCGRPGCGPMEHAGWDPTRDPAR